MNRIHCMNILALAAALTLPQSLHAAEATKGQDSQQALKASLIEHIDAKIRILETAKTCVRAASDLKAIAVCHEQERKQTKELRKQSRADIQDMSAKRKERKVTPPAPAPK